MNKQEKINIVVDMIKGDYSIEDIMKTVGYATDSGLRSFCYRNNISFNSIKSKNIVNKIFNTNVLNDIEFMYYFSGFVASDGYLDKNRPRIRIKIHSKDVGILHTFNEKLFINNHETKIYTDKNGYVDFHIQNTEIYNYMINIGITNNKSKTLKINYDLFDEKYIHHFIRGYFDGDGSVSVVRNKYMKLDGTISTYKKFLRSRFCGNYDTMSNIYNILSHNNILCNLNDVTLDKYSMDFFEVDIGTCDSNILFYNYLYKNATIYLNRKHNLFNEVIMPSRGESH